MTTRRCYCHPGRRAGGFTLVEILLAVTLATVLMGAVLAVLAGISRDQKRLTNANDHATRPSAAIELLRWDLTNATTITPTADGGVVLRGHGGLDASSLTPNNRLTRVAYRVRRDADGRTSNLVREQRYLDDPIHPEPWADLVMRGVRRVGVTPVGGGGDKPPRVTVTIVRDGGTVSEQLWVR